MQKGFAGRLIQRDPNIEQDMRPISYTRRQDFKEFDFSAFQDENADNKLMNMIREFAAKLDYKRLVDDPNIF